MAAFGNMELGPALFSESQIARAVEEIAAEIGERYDLSELVLVGAMVGAVCFLADLMRAFGEPVRVTTVRMSSYEGAGPGDVTSAVVSALSSDGLVWEKEPGIRLGSANGSYGAPRCLHLDPGPGGDGPRFRLYASDFRDHQIVSAASGDGLRFDMETGVRIARERELEAYEVYAPEVLRLGTGGYRMYYAGWVSAPEVPAGSKFHGRIFSAFSDDGLHWRKDPGICLDNGGRWDAAKASEPCLIDLADGRFRMFYEACDLEGRWRIASATSAASGQ